MSAESVVYVLLAAIGYLAISGLVYESLESAVGHWMALVAAALWPLTVVFYPLFVLCCVLGRLAGRAWHWWWERRRGVGW